MTKEELIQELVNVKNSLGFDEERAHCLADGLLLEYIDDERVWEAFNDIDIWHA